MMQIIDKTLGYFTVACSVLALLHACNPSQKKIKEAEKTSLSATDEAEQYPDSIGNSTSSQAYQRALHFWDQFDFSDTSKLHDEEYVEQSVVDYLTLIKRLPKPEINASTSALVEKAQVSPTALSVLAEAVEKYLYHPNSPYLDEDLFELIYTNFSKSDRLLPETAERIRHRLSLVAKNKVGSVANNFEYETTKGVKSDLHSISSPYVVLFIYEPHCEVCEETIANLKDSDGINRWIRDKKITFLATYALGERPTWVEYQGQIPQNWMNVNDYKKRILFEEAYDVQAFPTIYLLNHKNEVLLKDCSAEHLLQYLSAHIDPA